MMESYVYRMLMASLKVGFSVTKVAQSNFPPVTPNLENLQFVQTILVAALNAKCYRYRK